MMKLTKLKRSFGFLIVIFAVSGCSSDTRQPIVADRSDSAPLRPASQIPIVYWPRLKPLPLTDPQLEDLIGEATACGHPANSIWFILVRRNQEADHERTISATVYLEPDETSPRMRKGWCVHVNNELRQISKAFDDLMTPEARAKAQAERARDRGDRYCQISKPEQPFGSANDVPPFDLLPFFFPKGFSDSEVVEIADQTFAAIATAVEPGLVWHIKLGPNPIYTIERQSDGQIRVALGLSEGFCAGSGIGFLIEGMGAQMKVVNFFYWVS